MIKSKKYLEILQLMPVACMDLLVISNDQKMLLIKRAEEPEKDQWYFPGGRILKGDMIGKSALKIIKRECNLNCRFDRVLNVRDYFGIYKNIDVHQIVIECLLYSLNDNVKLDETSSDYMWTKQPCLYIPNHLKKTANIIEEILK